MKIRLTLFALFFCASTGLAYYQAEQGRFMNRDPVGEKGGLNLFAMVSNNTINQFDILGLAGSTTHGTKACKEEDDCKVLRAKIFQWSEHLFERYQEHLADSQNLKETNPRSYNNHIREIWNANKNLGKCFGFYVTHTPPCCKRPPKRARLRMPRLIDEPDGLSMMDHFLLSVPGTDQQWETAETIIVTGSATFLTGGAIYLSGGMLGPVLIPAVVH